jgi:F-type H+-transporting ATPase subunit a
LALAIFSVVYINVMAVKHLGLLSYGKKFFNFQSPIAFFIGLLEAFSEITRTISLAVRLFGNLFAGEVLLLVMLTLFPIILPLPFLALEMIIGILQAFIFAMLVVVFYSMAITHEEQNETS